MAEHSREYPQFPIPAVGAILLQEENVLLIRRGQAPAKGKWTFPGGVIELGESPEEALKREVREECGLAIDVATLVEVIHKVVEDAEGRIRYHYLILDYLVFCQTRPNCRQARFEAGTDVTDVRWISLHDLKSYKLTDGLIPVIDKAVAMNKAQRIESIS